MNLCIFHVCAVSFTCVLRRLRHLVTFAFIRMLKISRILIREDYTYVYVLIRIPRMHICMHAYVRMPCIGVYIYVSMYTHVHV